jgi:hypothetical protein
LRRLAAATMLVVAAGCGHVSVRTTGARPTTAATSSTVTPPTSRPVSIAASTRPSASVPATAATTSSTASPTPQVTVVTERDNGKSFVLSLASDTPLQLSNTWTWSPPVVEGTAVRLAPVMFFRDPGYEQWDISTTGLGEVTIRSQGTPSCTMGMTCSAQVVSFAVHILVR